MRRRRAPLLAEALQIALPAGRRVRAVAAGVAAQRAERLVAALEADVARAVRVGVAGRSEGGLSGVRATRRGTRATDHQRGQDGEEEGGGRAHGGDNLKVLVPCKFRSWTSGGRR